MQSDLGSFPDSELAIDVASARHSLERNLGLATNMSQRTTTNAAATHTLNENNDDQNNEDFANPNNLSSFLDDFSTSNTDLMALLAANGMSDMGELANFVSRTETATSSKLDRRSSKKHRKPKPEASTDAELGGYNAPSPAPSVAETFYSFAGDGVELMISESFGNDSDVDAVSLFGSADISQQDLITRLLGPGALAYAGPGIDPSSGAFEPEADQAPPSPYQQMLDVNLDFSDSPSDNFDDAASYISAVESLLSQEEVAGLLDEIERNDPSSATVMQSWIQTFGLDRLFPGLGAAEQPVASPQDLVGYASSSYASSSYAGSEVGDLDGEYDTDDASSTYTAGSASNPAAPPKKRRANGDGSGRPRKKGTPGGSHVCDECGKSFSRSFNLKMHKETHNENRDKNFPCPHCNMRFWREHDLTRHQPVHTGEKAFPCPVCQKKYSRIDALQRHQKKQEHW